LIVVRGKRATVLALRETRGYPFPADRSERRGSPVSDGDAEGSCYAMATRILLVEGKEVRLPDADPAKVADEMNRARGDLVPLKRDGAQVWINRRNVLYIEDGTKEPLVAFA
jgi:hypothetical protein